MDRKHIVIDATAFSESEFLTMKELLVKFFLILLLTKVFLKVFHIVNYWSKEINLSTKRVLFGRDKESSYVVVTNDVLCPLNHVLWNHTVSLITEFHVFEE